MSAPPVDTDLLVVERTDFQEILYEACDLRWSQIQLALNRFSYFDNWSMSQRQDCCTLSKIQQYEPLQTIYAEDTGNLNPVYFVLSGNCTILQCLRMNVSV